MKLAQTVCFVLFVPTLVFSQRGNWILAPQGGYGITSPLQTSSIFSRDEIPRNGPYYSLGVTITRENYPKRRNWVVGILYNHKSYLGLYGLGNKIYPNGQSVRVDDTLRAEIIHNYLDFPAHLNIPLFRSALSLRLGVHVGFLLRGKFVGRSIRTGNVIDSENLQYRGTDAILPRFGTFHLGVLYAKSFKNFGFGVEAFSEFEAPTIFAVVGIRRTHYFHRGNLVSGIKIHIPILVNRKKAFYSLQQ